MFKPNWNNLAVNLCFCLNCLLLFWAWFGADMRVPGALQVAGRMHTLVLHFPIVLLLLAVIFEMVAQEKKQSSLPALGDTLLLATALSAGASALFGLLLSREGGYESDTLRWHQWSGIGVSVLTWCWYTYRDWVRRTKNAALIASALSLVALLFAGHQGATMTHGENYLLAPLTPKKTEQVVSLEAAVVYADVLRPILKEKCMTCHNTTKSKGELVMETEALLLKGGKNGPLWDTTATDLGLLLRRVHLPADEKEHMPPKGKPQLTEDEIQMLTLWIKKGSDFKTKIVDLPKNDPLRLLAASRINIRDDDDTDTFAAADETTIEKLNNNYRSVKALAKNSPALAVSFFGTAAFNSTALDDLTVIKEQIVSLSLHKMPLTDEDVKKISIFKNLRNLNLSFTPITGAALHELKSLKNLRRLSLSGVALKATDLDALREFPNLSAVFLWETQVTEQDFADLKTNSPGLQIETGYQGDTTMVKLNAPIIEGEVQLIRSPIRVNLKNYVKGATVRYTLDGTVPDSLTSPISTGDSIVVEKTCLLSAKAFLSGWMSSEVATRNYYKTGFSPDSVALAFQPDPKYHGEGPRTLCNNKIGDTDFRNNKWLGFKETHLEGFLFFKQAVTLSSVTVSTVIDIGSYIMPADQIEIWGGSSKKDLVLLKKLQPQQPKGAGMLPNKIGFNCTFAAHKIKVLKVVAKPVTKLPAWHPGKGQRGWVFVDEIFLN